MKHKLILFAAALLTFSLDNAVHAQAFLDDNDGLLDVGEAPGFPLDPSGAFGLLELFDRGIEDLDGTSMLTNVEFLYLSINDIASIEPDDFNGLTNLQRLFLGANSFSSIEPGDFNGLTNLEWLDLRYTSLANIEPGGFDGLTNLKTLNLDDNSFLTSIKSDNFNGLTNLETLTLRDSSIASLEVGGFNGLTNLKFLELNGNNITSIGQGRFDGLTNLELLTLYENSITNIKPGGFDGLANLEVLSLYENGIAHIEPDGFHGLSNLKQLELSENNITDIKPGTFNGLANLEWLTLADNSIASIEPGDFNGLTNLKALDLSANSLTAVRPNAFSDLSNLQTLNLSDNGLNELNFTGATFYDLQQDAGSYGGFAATTERISSLVLDHATLSRGSFDAIVRQTTSIADVSLNGLTFSDEPPSDLSALLGIPTLDNVWVDPSFYGLYSHEFDAFAAMPGNTVTVVPEPSSALLLVVGSGVWLHLRLWPSLRVFTTQLVPDTSLRMVFCFDYGMPHGDPKPCEIAQQLITGPKCQCETRRPVSSI